MIYIQHMDVETYMYIQMWIVFADNGIFNKLTYNDRTLSTPYLRWSPSQGLRQGRIQTLALKC